MNGQVMISLEEYESLMEDAKWLQALQAAGVDNWEGFDYAREIYPGDGGLNIDPNRDLGAYTFGPAGFKRDPSKTITIPLSTYEAMQRRIASLEQQVFYDSWRINPERMGS